MRANMFIAAGAAALSLAAGIGIGYSYAKKRVTEYYLVTMDDTIDKEIRELQEYYQSKYEKKPQDIEVHVPKIEVQEFKPEVVEETVPDFVQSALTNYGAYSGAVAQYNKGIRTLAEVEAVLEADMPFAISQEEYMEGELDYEQFTCTFYAEDGVLVNEAEEPVSQPFIMVGSCLDAFVTLPTDEHVIYVRNPKLESDFEIVRNFDSYAASVGLTED